MIGAGALLCFGENGDETKETGHAAVRGMIRVNDWAEAVAAVDAFAAEGSDIQGESKA